MSEMLALCILGFSIGGLATFIFIISIILSIYYYNEEDLESPFGVE